MLARVIRDGLVEAYHEGAVAAVDTEGTLVAAWGVVDRPFYIRSAAKPFQAWVCLEAGAELSDEALAVACASHGGRPVHVALARRMLEEGGLDEGDLGCPPDWPLAAAERDRLVAEGHRRPRPIWRNCSGKHAAMLRACLARGWPTASYQDPEHPLQRRIQELLTEVTGERVGPVGVDGCGVPVARVTVLGLARAYGRLVTEPRFRRVAEAMHRFPSLVSDGHAPDARLASWLHAVAKGGAMGCMGVGIFGRMGVGGKCWDGSARGVQVGILAALEELGVVHETARRRLSDLATPAVRGGGRSVGRVEPALGSRP